MVKKLSALSQREKQCQVKNGTITLTAKLKKEADKLKRRAINLSDPDAPEIAHWRNAVRGKFYRPIKQQITVRIDADVLDWFKHHSDRYQTLINKVCREYMEHHAN